MPQINDVTATTEVVATETPVTETTGVVDATAVEKPAKKKVATKKPIKKEAADGESEKKLVRPPMDIITRDFESLITDHEIDGHKIKKLGYKCGKILFGLESKGDGKDYRIIAYKARKKTRTVAGKSRCIFYFGLVDDSSKHAKEIIGASSTKFGKCAVQSKAPIQVVLDKVTYDEVFEQNVDKIMSTLKKLVDITVKQRNSAWKDLQKKKAEKKESQAAAE
jgi:hypothetical protein